MMSRYSAVNRDLSKSIVNLYEKSFRNTVWNFGWKIWLLKRNNWIRRSWCHWRYKFSCTIEIWFNQLLEVTNKQASSIFINWINPFLSQIWSTLQNEHESITPIPKNILQESNSIDSLDANIDKIIQKIEKVSDIFTSLSNILSR